MTASFCGIIVSDSRTISESESGIRYRPVFSMFASFMIVAVLDVSMTPGIGDTSFSNRSIAFKTSVSSTSSPSTITAKDSVPKFARYRWLNS